MVQVSKVSFEYVDFHAKMSLILYPAFENLKTKWTLLDIVLLLAVRDVNGQERGLAMPTRWYP